MTPRAAPLLAVLFASLAGPALAADARLDPPEVKRTRGLLAIAARGALGAPTSAPLVARLRRDDATALEVAVAPDATGAFSVDLLTPRLLLPDHYVLEVGPKGGAPLVTRAFQSGTDAEIAAGHARLDAWYRGAHATLRDLAVALERRGHFHRALLAQDPPMHLERFDRAMDGWTVSLRAARMDLAVWERRLLLPRRPEAGAALLAMVRLLEARVALWQGALTTRGPAPNDGALKAAAATLVAALGLSPDALETWAAGPLATPAAGEKALEGLPFVDGFAAFEDAIGGFRLDVPEGLTPQPADKRPTERLLLLQGPLNLVVQVQDLPDLQAPAAIADMIATGAWEQYLSYKRLSTERLLDASGAVTGVRLELLADVQGTDEEVRSVRVTQVSRWPTTGRRVVHLQVVTQPDAPPPPWLERVVASFGATP